MAKWKSTMAGRPRKPTALLKLEGSFRRDRHGDRVQEPDAPLGGPPGHLPADARLAWRQVAGSATWLRRPDRPLVELYAQLQAAARRDFAAMSAAKLSLLAGVAGRLGLGPVDRARVHAASAAPEDDGTSEFFNDAA